MPFHPTAAPRHEAWGLLPGRIQYPAIWRGSPGREVMDSVLLRRDCRRFVCDRCRQVVYICSWCDRGHRYCSDRCRRGARRRSLLEAGRRYQRSRRGRLRHARRQARYRARQRASRKKVTHHSCRTDSGSASVRTCTTKPPESSCLSPSAHGVVICGVCGHLCEPFVRDDFLRCRRPRRPRTPALEVGDDLGSAGRRDPTAVHRRGLA